MHFNKNVNYNSSGREEYASKAEGTIVDVMKTMRSLGSLDSTVFPQVSDAVTRIGNVGYIESVGY